MRLRKDSAVNKGVLVGLGIATLAACAPIAPKPPPARPAAQVRQPSFDLIWDVAERIHTEYLTPVETNVLLTRALDGVARTPGLDDASRTALHMAARRIGEARTPLAQATELKAALGATSLPAASVREAALTAMLDGLDPRTSYTSPDMFRAMQVSSRPATGSVGLNLSRIGDDIVVERPLVGSLAARAGVKPRDLLLSIDGRDVRALKLPDVITLLQGPVGSIAVLVLRRLDQTIPVSIPVERATFKYEPVHSELLGSTAYLALDTFDERMVSQLSAKIAAMRTANPALGGIVLDLRGSQGGLLDTVANVARYFLPHGSTVFTTEARHEEENQSSRATQDGQATDLPMVVLVDAKTASGAEIVAGALQDNRRALIVGAPTYGAGTVQTIMPLPSGNGALRLTTARVMLPSGRPLGTGGITPDVIVRPGSRAACTPTPCDLLARLRALRANPMLLGDGPDGLALEVAKAMQP